jgi:hypothetical protein
MEQYLDAKVKRFVQRRLFSRIDKAKTILGLAGTHPEEYMKILPYHKQVILVDYNPVNPSVRRNSLVGEFDLITSQPVNHNPITFVDCDFCKSVVTCGDDFTYIYNKMKKSAIHNKYIAFTFSLRNVGLERTLEFLSQFMNIPKCYSAPSLHICELKSRQFVKQFLSTDESTTTRLPLYMYRDSGACMISGLIKL